MTTRTRRHQLDVATELFDFIEQQVLPGTGVASAAFWRGFDAIVTDLAPKNAALLAERDRLQAELDQWHKAHPGPIRVDEGLPRLPDANRLSGAGAGQGARNDEECRRRTGLQAGPQLVVPILNARYALNAANARWGSLYDALYGTDVIDESDGASRAGGYNPIRGAKVVAYARHVLDRTAPLKSGSHVDSTAYAVLDGQLAVTLANGKTTSLRNGKQCVGYQGDAARPSSVLLQHNGLHIDIRIDHGTATGAADAAGVSDVVLEAALSTILDLEDSVAAVDAQDKVLGYRNWLGILKGD